VALGGEEIEESLADVRDAHGARRGGGSHACSFKTVIGVRVKAKGSRRVYVELSLGACVRSRHDGRTRRRASWRWFQTGGRLVAAIGAASSSQEWALAVEIPIAAIATQEILPEKTGFQVGANCIPRHLSCSTYPMLI
jgi:hypothetical protein